MSGGSSPGRVPSNSLEGAVSTDDFYPLPEYVASLIPPAGEPVSFDRFVPEHGVEDEKEEASFYAGPQEGSSGIDERGDQEIGSSVEDGGEQERGSDIDDRCAEELGSVAGGAHNLDSGSDVPQEGSLSVDDAGVGYKKSGGEDEGDARRSTARTTHLEGLDDSGAMTSDGVTIKEPLVKRGRGRPKVTRFKSFMDLGAKKKAKKDKRDAIARPEGLSQQTTFCKRCRKPGHNSSTCTVIPDGWTGTADHVPESLPKKPRRQNKCRKCGGSGHNSATCTAGFEEEDAGLEEDA